MIVLEKVSFIILLIVHTVHKKVFEGQNELILDFVHKYGFSVPTIDQKLTSFKVNNYYLNTLSLFLNNKSGQFCKIFIPKNKLFQLLYEGY